MDKVSVDDEADLDRIRGEGHYIRKRANCNRTDIIIKTFIE